MKMSDSPFKTEREIIDEYQKRMISNQFSENWANSYSSVSVPYDQKSPREKYKSEIRQLKDRLHKLELEKLIEDELRLEHKGLQDAWEQYQILLRLTQK